MARKIEVEMKYEVARPGSADRYLVAPELGPFTPDGQVRSMRVEDRYVDSADWALARAGFAARLRKTSRGTEISIKATNVSPGRLHRREEIEGPADEALVPGGWPASQARNVVVEFCGDEPLIEMLTIRQLRRVRLLAAGGTRAELSLDEVEVIGQGRVLDTFEELEVELKRGDEKSLQGLVELFDTDPALTAVSRSKLDRAMMSIRTAMPSMPAELRHHWEGAPAVLLAGVSPADAADAADAADRPGHADRTGDAAGAASERAADVAPVAQSVAPAAQSVAPAAQSVAPAAQSVAPAAQSVAPAAQSVASAAQSVASAAEPEAPTRLATEPAPHRKPNARAVGIVADDSMPEAAVKVVRFHFGKMQRREAGTRSGSDAEDLHDMRVSTRRMRAAWRVFDGAFKAGKTRKIRRHLETIADKLGVVRDLDVLIEGLEAYGAGLDDEKRPGLAPLETLWRRQRGNARAQLISELDSPSYAAFVKEMEDFLEDGANSAAAFASPTSPHRVRDRAASRIWAAYEAVRAYELVLPWADVETLHDLRIATKWLRYTLEFFGETLGPDFPRLLERVVALQEHLGLLHDADVASKLARDMLVARAGDLSSVEADAIGSYLRSRERELERRRRGLGTVWRAVSGAPFRRALGRATAAL
jgi:CHAD domain-containing protein